MMELDTGNARVIVEFMRSFFLSPVGIFLYAVTTGVIGIFILLLFFSMMLSPSALILFLPVIIAFNGAASGYGIADKREFFSHQKAGLISIVAILTLAGSALIILFCPWEPLLDENRIFTSGVITLGSTFFGAWIATKNKALHTTS